MSSQEIRKHQLSKRKRILRKSLFFCIILFVVSLALYLWDDTLAGILATIATSGIATFLFRTKRAKRMNPKSLAKIIGGVMIGCIVLVAIIRELECILPWLGILRFCLLGIVGACVSLEFAIMDNGYDVIEANEDRVYQEEKRKERARGRRRSGRKHK